MKWIKNLEFSANGLKFAFDVKTTLNISDITFYPSQTTHGYDLYASSTDKEDILFLNLATGKHENSSKNAFDASRVASKKTRRNFHKKKKRKMARFFHF